MFNKPKPEKLIIQPKQLIILLRNPNCDCCPFECNPEAEMCMLFEKAADCIETLLKKGNQ